MTTRIDARFAELKREGRAAFITFLMAGHPDIDTSLAIIKAHPEARADLGEIPTPLPRPIALAAPHAAASARVTEAVGRIKRDTRLPVSVGFGIRTPEAARAIAETADGAVVGTALVDALRASLDAEGRATPKTVGAVADLVAALAQGVRGAKQAAE